jgi:O-acetyl-ADP-ribose deacetylase (regulator of RNase III)
MKEVFGDLIKMAKDGHFDLIIHGCNCFCTMGNGIAKQIKEEFPNVYDADRETKSGDIDKLGNYTFAQVNLLTEKTYADIMMFHGHHPILFVLNCYTQYNYGTDRVQIDYEALTLVLRKINHNFKGKSIGIPKIGAGLAGGDWNKIKEIINKELNAMDVTIVIIII